ncbi:hypothetical protein BDQ12DRAFT_694298 [Crucibulum laeve]|uniref:Uncharacterized protein n=1 Tax=Crucibulum laeve TaxID=68775 RepID=A0A5C3LRI5_9AGAR|nr:hypothetical protein BDQ12DRAFT_694298 [Crucibulum laeve]
MPFEYMKSLHSRPRALESSTPSGYLEALGLAITMAFSPCKLIIIQEYCRMKAKKMPFPTGLKMGATTYHRQLQIVSDGTATVGSP